ncbi:phospholipid-transporting ATPase ABCA1-like [Culex pipiens pallens]|nr:phospholipid-transporting ATPase ABCA1-like [Culex pipiens pallens]XP_039428970.1 phospholipid-transporting ATPase ABCA1-like [Culex pipiens pallens]XP_039428971.1 phospholipid-transporting ATPase ABCA1-like [Culex pipiens pallens]XP_039428972.1 phospholipid-transporting ATPase ABCA1-like [Culex pipiens pallens]
MVVVTAQGSTNPDGLPPQVHRTGNGEKFVLLLWKNFLLHWRSKVSSLVEIFIPPFFMLLLVGLRSLTEVQINNYESVYNPLDITNFTGIRDRLVVPFMPTIAYSPRTDFLDQLMEPVGRRTEMNVQGFASAQDMQNFLMASHAFVGVQFDEHYEQLTSLPTRLSYTLRFPGELRAQFGITHAWRTNSRFASRPDGGARFYRYDDGGPSPGYFREGFLSIQHFIFRAFLEAKKTVNKELPEVHVQRFPYPPFLEDSFPSSLTTFLPISVMLAFIYPCISIVKSVLFEKEKQIKEAMKIMGLSNWILWSSWFVKSLFFIVISVSLVVLFLNVPWYSTPDVSVLTHSDAGVIWLFFFIYGIAIITFSFMLSTLFSKANSGGAVAAVIWFIAFAPYAVMDQDYGSLSASDKLAASLLLNTAIGFGLRLIGVYEGTTQGMQWSTLFHDSDVDNINLGSIMLMLLADAVIYMLIALYVEQVFPGDFGLAQPWYFPVSKRFWFGESPTKDPFTEDPPSKKENIEDDPKGRPARIVIKGLRKVYSNKKVAVEGLSFSMFEGHITALLGHNGAGKTTTMSMLTGMKRPSSGTALIYGHDIRHEMKKIRNSLGYCPQHNILFEDLTVKEHLYFYSRIKGLSDAQAQYEVNRYIKSLELVDKTNVVASSLSGGMQRKLCVGIALCAGSKVVLCDEPTSGMDPAARRALWDLLIAEKSHRTMILSTHFMDEADMLGDRIAIMADGKLKAVGSSFFLKKKYGVGYRLICVKSAECNVTAVTELLRKHIVDIAVESSIGSELSYLLHEEYVTRFQSMLEDLEDNLERLHILDFGISLTTLEEVFMKVGSDSTNMSDAISMSSIATTSTDLETNSSVGDYELMEGLRLFLCQLKALFLKKVYQTYRNWFLFLVQIGIPILFVSVTIAVVRAWIGSRDMPSRLLSMASHNPSVTLVQVDPSAERESLTEVIYANFLNQFRWIEGLAVSATKENIVRVFLDLAVQNLVIVNRHYVIGASIMNDNCTAWFNNEALHSPAISLNALHNALLRTFTNSSKYRIDVTNHPLPYTDETRLQMSRAHNNLGFQLAYNTGFGMAFVSGFFVIFYIRERVTKAKLLQFVSGVNRFSYWFTGFIWDYFTYAIVCLFIIAVVAMFQEPGFSRADEVFRLYAIFMIIGLPALPLAYITTLYYSVPPAAFIRVSVAFIVTGTALFIFVFLLGTEMFELDELSETLSTVFLVFPHFVLCDAIVSLSRMSITIEMCDAARPPGVTPMPICDEDLYYFQWDRPGIGRHLYYSLVMTAVYFGVLFLLDFKVLKLVVQKSREWYYRGQYKLESAPENQDSDVRAEKQRIAAMTEAERKDTNLVAHEMTKYYNRFLAVNQLSVGINSYECFGLLGANGAGKTTTFKMLSGDETISFGNAWIKGNSLKTSLKQVHKHIGYCPQFDALIEDLTGRETLKLFSLLRGVPGDKIVPITMFLAKEFGFAKHLDKQVKAYSGGNKRKLSTALALLGNPSVVYLDEPTSGMDPGAKRNLWNGVCRVRDSGKTIVLTSHSMEECEALCTRLAIMVNGEFKCIGSTQHLKNKFSQGFVLIIKAKKTDSVVKTPEGLVPEVPDLQKIKDFVGENFTDTLLKEEYQDLLTYYIRSQNLKWSQIFGIMENCKSTLNVEDYSIGQTSLEQVFLSFTKFQREE